MTGPVYIIATCNIMWWMVAYGLNILLKQMLSSHLVWSLTKKPPPPPLCTL